MGDVIHMPRKADEKMADAIREIFERAIGEMQALGLSKQAIASELMTNAVFEAWGEGEDNAALVAKVQKSAGLFVAGLFDSIGE
jgi:hypothetical protein